MLVRTPLALVAAVMALAPSPAHAFRPGPETSYTLETSCGTYRFVMFGPDTGRKDAAIRTQYPASGLYRIGEPPVPLWTVNWYAYKSCVVPLTDGVHLVVHPSWASRLEFHANGQLVRRYTDWDLVELPWLAIRHRDTSGAPPPGMNSGAIDESNLIYSISPGGGSSYTFDIRTGAMLSAFRPWRIVASVFLVALLLAIVVIWRYRVGKPRPEQLPASIPPPTSDAIRPG